LDWQFLSRIEDFHQCHSSGFSTELSYVRKALVVDVFTKKKRSQVMAAIRSTGNKDTELKLVAIMRTHDITGWRRHQRLPGKPDFVFRRQRLAVFVDGCFWHGCPRHSRPPHSNQFYWTQKIARNIQRDHEINRLLKKEGWHVLRIWEHALGAPNKVACRITSLLADKSSCP